MDGMRSIDDTSTGMFSASDWSEEGDGLFQSARTTRATWLRKCRTFSDRIDKAAVSRRLLSELKGLPRASVLLLGYSVEMYLKGGLVKAYRGCREELFRHDSKKKFRHKLASLATEIDFPHASSDRHDFHQLQKLIVSGARYPIEPGMISIDARTRRAEFSRQLNERTALIWSDDRFRQLCALSARVRAHVDLIDNDENNPAHLDHGYIGETGYWVFRIGGLLRPRVTYRPCNLNRDLSEEDVRKEVEQRPKFRALTRWDDCETRHDNI
jgi:hypothetical protein